MGRNKNGKKGENLELIVPEGTQVIDAQTNEVLLDLTKEGQRELFLKGGKGGLEIRILNMQPISALIMHSQALKAKVV